MQHLPTVVEALVIVAASVLATLWLRQHRTRLREQRLQRMSERLSKS